MSAVVSWRAIYFSVCTLFFPLFSFIYGGLANITETPESLALIDQAAGLEEKAAAIIQDNRLDVTSHPAELVEELANLNAILRKSEGTATTQAQNTRIEQRIEELRIEESTLITTQAKSKGYDLVLAKSAVLMGGTDITDEIARQVK